MMRLVDRPFQGPARQVLRRLSFGFAEEFDCLPGHGRNLRVDGARVSGIAIDDLAAIVAPPNRQRQCVQHFRQNALPRVGLGERVVELAGVVEPDEVDGGFAARRTGAMSGHLERTRAIGGTQLVRETAAAREQRLERDREFARAVFVEYAQHTRQGDGGFALVEPENLDKTRRGLDGVVRMGKGQAADRRGGQGGLGGLDARGHLVALGQRGAPARPVNPGENEK